MKFDDLMESFGSLISFNRPDLSLMFGESDSSLGVSMHRLKKTGKIIELKRGLYALAEPWRKAVLHGPLAANVIYRPSYLSGLWALSWYGIIPEKTELYTSATTRATRTFENPFGRFLYQTLKPSLFGGWVRTAIAGAEVLIAAPEKALADYFYLESGEWNETRMTSMRFDPADISTEKLAVYLEATGEARLARALSSWRRYAAELAEGTVTL